MGIIFDLYKLKLKLFFGSLRASKGSIILLLIYTLSMLPGTIGMSMAIVDLIKKGADLTGYLDLLSTIISGFLALILLSTLRGFTAFEYEQSFIFTSPIVPKKFLIAGMLSDFTAFFLFFYPLPVFLGIVTVSLSLSVSSVLLLVVSFLLFVFFLLFVRTALSILEAVYGDRGIKVVTALMVLLLIFPAIGIFIHIPIRYGDLPYPSTFLAQSLLGALYGRSSPAHSLLGLAFYFFASLLVFQFSSKINFFQFTTSVPSGSPFDTSMRMQTVKMGKNIQLFSRVGLGITLDFKSRSLLCFLMKKEFIRMIRDGSLFSVFLFYAITSIITVVSGTERAPIPISTLLLAIYSFIVPSMLIGNWRISEMRNLWIPLTSGINLKYIVKSLLYDFTSVASIIPVIIIGALTFISQLDPLIPLVMVISVSMVGCSTNLYVAVIFLNKRYRATPSFMISWVSILLSSLLLTPTYIFAASSILLNITVELNLLLSVPIFVYSTLIFIYFIKKLEKETLSIEL